MGHAPARRRVKGWPDSVAYTSDVALMVLDSPLGAKAGTMGFKYSPAGYRGRLYAAGYPAVSVRSGTFFELRNNCTVADRNGRDGSLLLKVSEAALRSAHVGVRAPCGCGAHQLWPARP